MKAIIVDDEPKAIQLIRSYLENFRSIELVATFRNGLKAFEYLHSNPVDLIFLDINMPHLSGISLSKMIGKNRHLIFTTAYSEYAVESYEVQAVDYLVKPISLERFTQSMSRLFSKIETEMPAMASMVLVKSGYKTHRIQIDDILYLEKEGNYITYHLKDEKIIVRESIPESLERLGDNFIQIHRSFVVHIDKVQAFDKESIDLENVKIPIGSTFQTEVLKRLNSWG